MTPTDGGRRGSLFPGDERSAPRLEAIDSVQRAYPIDSNRFVMAGFSMGGASAWSYTVHFADRWVAAAPGAGFTETEVFLHGGLARQPQNAVQRTLWHMYDSTDYAANTFNLPVVAYSTFSTGSWRMWPLPEKRPYFFIFFSSVARLITSAAAASWRFQSRA